MFAPRFLSRVISSSAPCSSSLLAISHVRAAATSTAAVAAAAAAAGSHSSFLSSSLSSASSSSHLLRRCFSSGTPADALNGGQRSQYAAVSSPEVKALVHAAEQSQLPDRLTAQQYAALLQNLDSQRADIPAIQRARNFLTPDRDDPTVNNAILELFSEAFESNWTEENRQQVTAFLKKEWDKGGDAALVIAINKLLENRVTIRGIIDSLGGWYPLLGLAAVIAVSKELIIVNEELLMVTNFLAVFGGIYFQLADTVLDGYKSSRTAEAKKYYDRRQLEIDTSKALLAAYEKNPKVVELLEQLKTDVNQLITERSRAKFAKKQADIQRHFLKALDTVVAAEAQAEAKIRRQIVERFADYMQFMLLLERVRDEGFFSDGIWTAVTQLLLGRPSKAQETPVGRLVKTYITHALWRVDWKNLKLDKSDLRTLGISDSIKLAQFASNAKKEQFADWEKFLKENPKATQEDYFKARGMKGPITLVEYIRDKIKKNPEEIKALIVQDLKEEEQWEEELTRLFAESEKARKQAKVATKTEKKKRTVDVEKMLEQMSFWEEQQLALAERYLANGAKAAKPAKTPPGN